MRKNTNTGHVKSRQPGAQPSPPSQLGLNLAFLKLGWRILPSSRAFPLSLTSPLRPASQSRVRLDPFSLLACAHVTYWQINTMSTTCKCSLYMI